MVFTKKEKYEIIEYVTHEVSEMHGLELSDASKIVKDSVLMTKIIKSPAFVAHCSVGQLVDLVTKNGSILCPQR